MSTHKPNDTLSRIERVLLKHRIRITPKIKDEIGKAIVSSAYPKRK